METFWKQGAQAYDQVVPALQARNSLPSFSTPKGEVEILGMLSEAGEDVPRADYAILVIAADAAVPSSSDAFETWQTMLAAAGKVIALVNKMDSIKWSEARFNTIAEDTMTCLKKLAVNVNDITTIPVSGLHGDNLIEQSPNSPWHTVKSTEKSEDGKASMTLLEAIDSDPASFRRSPAG